MARQSINVQSGDVLYRTKLMSYDRAKSFAACLKANPDFSAVSVAISDKAKGERKYFVQYQPSSRDRLIDAYQREIDKRAMKAGTEGWAYEFFFETDSPRPFYWCLSVSGEVYEVDASTCSCPDHIYRCSRGNASNCGVICKHRQRLHSLIEAGSLLSPREARAAEQSHFMPLERAA